MGNPLHRHEHVAYDFYVKEGSPTETTRSYPIWISMEPSSGVELNILKMGSLSFVMRDDVPYEKAKELQQMLHSMVKHVSYNEHVVDDPWFVNNDINPDLP